MTTSIQPNVVAEIDRITIEVLMDNRTDALSSVPGSVESEFSRVLRRGSPLSGRCLCCAAHGLALLLTVESQGRRAQVLFDAGPDAALFARNVEVRGTDLSEVDDVVLSRGHWDHAAGLTTALPLITGPSKRTCPVHLNPGMFVRRGVRMAGDRVLPFEEIPSPDELRALGAEPLVRDSEQIIGRGMVYLSGEIPRVTGFETGFAGHVRWNEATGQWEDDPLILDERFVAVRLRGLGVLAFSACSHAGVVNVMRAARERFPDDPLYGVVGGLHLSGLAMEAKIAETVSALKAMNLRLVVPAHCTGWRATAALVESFGESAVIPAAVGQILTLGQPA